MKALVLAGGSGSRLRPFSHSMPKQLIPLANKPILEYVLEDIRAAGRDRRRNDRRAVGGGDCPSDRRRRAVRLSGSSTSSRTSRPGLADCVRLARDFLGDDDFVMYLGDNVLPDGIADVAVEFREQRAGGP